MDFEYQLKTLPPEALEVIRYYGTLDAPVAHAHQITAATHLSERAFGRAIRRLVTRGYLNMDGEGRYRLTDLGQRAVETFAATDDGTNYAAEVIESDDSETFTPASIEKPAAETVEEALESETDFAPSAPETADEDWLTPQDVLAVLAAEPVAPPSPPVIEAQTVTRRLIVAAPRTLVAGKAETVHVGFEDDDTGSSAADLLVRLSVINGEPARAQDWSVALDGGSAYKTFEVTAGEFTQTRLRITVFQLLDDGNEVEQAGGLYVDLDVTADSESAAPLAAYGIDVPLAL